MSNPTVILNGDQIFCDELIRENARLTVQHEADGQKMKELRAAIIKAESEAVEIAAVDESVMELELERELKRAETDASGLSAKLAEAIKDLHFVMAGGDPCKVCAKVCMMGEGNCQPEWTGEKTED